MQAGSGLKITGVVVAVALAGGAWLGHAAFTRPASHPLPLPGSLIAADSPAGRALLGSSEFRADYAALTQRFETQSRPAFCGVASSVIVLNALGAAGAPLTQATFFDEPTRQIRSPLRVTFAGMTLGQLGAVLGAHGVAATIHFASDSSVEMFRASARQNLGTAGDYMLVNYQRSELGQKPTAHISPVAAYEAKADRMLVLDVATYKYPPVWVATGALFKAMSAVDPASGRTRGFVEVKRP